MDKTHSSTPVRHSHITSRRLAPFFLNLPGVRSAHADRFNRYERWISSARRAASLAGRARNVAARWARRSPRQPRKRSARLAGDRL